MSGAQQEDPHQALVEDLLSTSRLFVAVVARSLAAADAALSTPQLRVLVLLATRGGVNLATVAEGLGVNPSNASRTCEQLVVAGLVSREEDAADRRQVVLDLTDEGARLVRASMDHRREVFDRLVAAMGPQERDHLAQGLEGMLATAQEQSHPPAGAADDPPEQARDADRLLRWLL